MPHCAKDPLLDLEIEQKRLMEESARLEARLQELTRSEDKAGVKDDTKLLSAPDPQPRKDRPA